MTEGGAIRLSNGKIARRHPFPLETDIDMGKRYVLFLTYSQRTQEFTIVKVWGLQKGHAEPSAETDLKDVKTGKSKYAGMAESDFLNAVQQSVTSE